ncbi:MAG: hypothetical protein ACTSP4_01715 [Candidatus Hodarchaeales archaeon]
MNFQVKGISMDKQRFLDTINRALRGYSVFQVGLYNYFSSRGRILVFLSLQLMPVLGALIDTQDYSSYPLWDPGGFLGIFIGLSFVYTVNLILVIETLFFALSITRDDFDSQTISYWINTPLSRIEILTWKYLAYCAFSCLMFIPTTVIFFFIQGRSIPLISSTSDITLMTTFPYLVNAIIIQCVAIFLYGAIFFLFAVFFTKPLLPALLVTFVDVIFSYTPFVDLMGAVSPAYHIRSIARQLQIYNRNENIIYLIGGTADAGSPFVVSYLIIICLLLSIYFFRRKDLHQTL